MWREANCRHAGGGALCPSAREVANPPTHGQDNAAIHYPACSVQTKVRPVGTAEPGMTLGFFTS